MFLAEIGVMIMSVARTIPHFRYTPQCLSITASSIFLGCWYAQFLSIGYWNTYLYRCFWIERLSSLVFESILFTLTLIQFLRIVHRDYITGKHTFVYIFIRDGIWAFALIFGVSPACSEVSFINGAITTTVIFLITTLMYQLDAPIAAACFL